MQYYYFESIYSLTLISIRNNCERNVRETLNKFEMCVKDKFEKKIILLNLILYLILSNLIEKRTGKSLSFNNTLNI